MPYIVFFKTIDADISLHFSRFIYHSFGINVKILFRNNEKVQNKFSKKNKHKTELNICDR